MGDKNSTVWITGGSSGIGKALTLEFSQNGYQVAASARTKKALERIKKEAETDANLDLYPADITKFEEVKKTVGKINGKSNISCVINNAGLTSFKLAEENSIEEIESIIATNLIGAINTIKAVLPTMIAQKKGTIINILSVAANNIFTKSSAYAASKAGLRAYAQVLREEVREHNIRVINILPGATRTPIWPNEALEKYGERMMSPTDLAKLVREVYSIDSNLVAEEIQIRPIKGDI